MHYLYLICSIMINVWFNYGCSYHMMSMKDWFQTFQNLTFMVQTLCSSWCRQHLSSHWNPMSASAHPPEIQASSWSCSHGSVVVDSVSKNHHWLCCFFFNWLCCCCGVSGTWNSGCSCSSGCCHKNSCLYSGSHISYSENRYHWWSLRSPRHHHHRRLIHGPYLLQS